MKAAVPLFILLLLMASCKEDTQVNAFTATPLNLKTPSHLPIIDFDPNNPMTVEGVALGRMLYYDPILDGKDDRTCAQCHLQEEGFSSFKSNALAHVNLAWQDKFLWNGGVEGSLEDVMIFESQDFFATDLERINAHAEYPDLFKKAFGVDEIGYTELGYALAQFTRTLISSNSRYDLYLKGYLQFTPAEQRGMEMYFSEKADCFHCHGSPLMTDVRFHNNALDSFPDAGRFETTGDPNDFGAFKTPALRNIEVTAPYMHDGRFSSLEEVVEFYSTGLIKSPTVSSEMKYVDAGGVQLTANEQADLVAFLKTLTDTSFLNNPALADPFE